MKQKGERLSGEKKNLGGLAFLPLLVFLALYIGTGVILSIMGAESTFGAFPRHVALLAGFAVAMLMSTGDTIQEKTDKFCEHMGNSGVMQVILIYLLASGFQGAAATMGGKESVVNLALHFIPVKLLIPGVFLMCCLISTAPSRPWARSRSAWPRAQASAPPSRRRRSSAAPTSAITCP